MSWRDDNEEFFSEISNPATQARPAGPCELCIIKCPRCAVPLHQHTQAGLTGCAWRGYPCQSCGQPPHPDNAEGRCEAYTHPQDTARERGLRLMSPWRRGASGPLYAFRHCNARRHGKLEPDGQQQVHELAVRESSPPPLVTEPGELAGMNVEQLAGALRVLREPVIACLPSPERDRALRELASRQVAESRARAGRGPRR